MDQSQLRRYNATFKGGKVVTSWHLINWIVSNSKFKKNARLVSIQIAFHYNIANQVAFPSFETLAATTGLSRSAIAKAVKILKEDGTEWRVTKENNSQSYQPSNHYRFVIPNKYES